MARMLLSVILALFILQTWASPIISLRKRSFKVPLLEQKDYVPNGKAALRRAYLKFGLGDIVSKREGEALGARAPVNAFSRVNGGAASGTEDGETPAVGVQGDAQFLAPVKIGGQQLILNFDTGSADLWVFSSLLPEAARVNRTVYDVSIASQRQGRKLVGGSFDIGYGDGSAASGDIGIDEVDIGGSTVARQVFGVAKKVSPSFMQDRASNGLVGLAFSTLNTFQPTQQKTFFENVVNDLSSPVFTAQLKGGTDAAYEFGRIDDTAYTGTLAHVPIDNSRGFWEFDAETAQVNGESISIPGATAIADTGTSLMLVPEAILRHYWDQVSGSKNDAGAGGWTFPCNAKLPDLQVAVGPAYNATVPGKFMNYAQVDVDANGNMICFGGLQSNQGLPFAIYGDVWFKSQFVAFQATGPSLGVAPHS